MLSTSEFMDQQYVLGNSYAGLVQVQEMMESGLTLVAVSDDVEATIDLTEPYAANAVEVEAGAQAGRLSVATLALIRHIETRTGQSLNNWLYTNGLKVTQSFADLSDALGVTINALNIE
jgi:hypothetical protein